MSWKIVCTHLTAYLATVLSCFLSDKRVSESSERRADRRQRTWYLCHRQEHDIGGTRTRLRRRHCMHHLPMTS